MIRVKCIHKFKSASGRIQGYKLIDQNGVIKNLTSEELKQAIKNNKITVTNLKLTTDDRLIDIKEPSSQNKIKAQKTKTQPVKQKPTIKPEELKILDIINNIQNREKELIELINKTYNLNLKLRKVGGETIAGQGKVCFNIYDNYIAAIFNSGLTYKGKFLDSSDNEITYTIKNDNDNFNIRTLRKLITIIRENKSKLDLVEYIAELYDEVEGGVNTLEGCGPHDIDEDGMVFPLESGNTYIEFLEEGVCISGDIETFSFSMYLNEVKDPSLAKQHKIKVDISMSDDEYETEIDLNGELNSNIYEVYSKLDEVVDEAVYYSKSGKHSWEDF